MSPMEINVPTIIVGAIIFAAMVWAVRRLTKRGMCDCKDCCDAGSCSKCGASERMVEDMEQAISADANASSCTHGAKRS